MSATPDLRASDEDRERLAGEIREHFAAGRLTQEELDERLRVAYAARTRGELQVVRADLPDLPPSPAELQAELGRRRARLRRGLIQETGGGLMAFLICVVIWLAAGAHGYFWPVWVAIALAIALLSNGWRLYGPDPQLDRVEQELTARRRHRERRRGYELERAERRRERRDQRRLDP